MAYIIQDSTLTEIADAIRAKRETTEKIKVSNMKAEIEAIEGDKSGAIIDRSITKYSNDNIKSIGDYAFQCCRSLASVDFPSATSIGSSAFQSCGALASVDFPSATSIGSSAFQNCGALTSVVFPSATDIGYSAFRICYYLTSVDFPSATTIGYSAFGNCSSLINLILRGNTVCVLSDEGALSGTEIQSGTGYIYVPKSILDSYKTATNWSNYAAQFRALEDYTVDGTTTGELDTTKI